MIEGMCINPIELQEMARVMLSEIYSAEKAQSMLADLSYIEGANRTDKRFFSGLESFSRSYSGFGNISGFQRQGGAVAEGAEFNPRLSRREYLEQRSERLKQREPSLNSAVFNEIETELSGIKQHDNLTQEDLSEKLSERFCRDARRYNGAFERY
ncbi:MAG: hypothetical protein KBI01_07885 [Oscillospiraceae bacterium]|nr:hypothetical protein [Oscillospiraceae bacterium]